MRVFLSILAALVAGLCAAGYFLQTPETDYQTMLERYGGARARFATAESGMRIHYRDEGFKDGPVLVLLHGSNASLHTWEPLVERLEGAHRLVSVDLPGHGLSGPHPEADYSAAGMIDGLEAALDAAGIETFFLAGNSMGGKVAWRYALDHPERVEGLVLLNASGAPIERDESEGAGNLLFTLLMSPVGREALKRYTPRGFVESSLLQSVSVEAIVDEAMVDRYWDLNRLPSNKEATLAAFNSTENPYAAEMLGEISAPTLIVWGDEDPIIPVEAAAVFAREIPGAEVAILEGVGHIPMEEAPDETARLVEAFIAKTRAARR